jgi:hypothetical protein
VWREVAGALVLVVVAAYLLMCLAALANALLWVRLRDVLVRCLPAGLLASAGVAAARAASLLPLVREGSSMLRRLRSSQGSAAIADV